MSDKHLRQHGGTRRTPQDQPIPGSNQVQNPSGGHAWQVGDMERLQRFLILGAEGGTYYTSEAKLTRDSVGVLGRCVEHDGPATVAAIIGVSLAGRAPKNDPALFALAYASAHGNEETRRAAYEGLPEVARIGTHLFHFIAYRELFAGWSAGLRKAVARWYLDKSPSELAYQLIKYRQRDGWSHRDVLRLAHVKPSSPTYDVLFKFATTGSLPDLEALPAEDRDALEKIRGFDAVQAASTPAWAADAVTRFRLPRETVPTEYLKSPDVWNALLNEPMPLEALIRNLVTLTRVGVIKPMSEGERLVVNLLSDDDRLRKSRVHPIRILAALSVYSSGHSPQGRGDPWQPSAQVCDALDAAFYEAFGNVEPAGKRTLMGLDVSSSMKQEIAGIPGLSASMGAAAMALITASIEPDYATIAFSSSGGWHAETGFTPMPISPRERLDDVMARAREITFGRTDCSLPMLFALQEGIEVDTFVVYTDNETNHGSIHPAQALRQYREKSEIDARLVVVGMTSDGFSIADPDDPRMLDVVGFDTAAPGMISAFSRGEI